MDKRVINLSYRISDCSKRAVKKRENLISIMERETERYQKRIKKLSDKKDFWKSTTSQFTFVLEPLA
jgi:hypothetical protein